MKCEEAKLLLADYWAQTLRDQDEMELEAHFATCPACREETVRLESMWKGLAALPPEEPDSKMRSRFYESLGAYRLGAESRAKKWWPLSPALQIAASFAILALGLAGGYALRTDNTSDQVAQLREEVTGMRQLVALSLLQQQSASERLRGVGYAFRAEPSNTEVLAALVSAINNDASVNVRLAAVDALHTFSGSPSTRQAVMEALPKQNVPLVQVALIDLLVDFKDRQARPELRRLASDESVNDGVKQRALWALETLQ
ncbi:MAG: HEAT repeat domain-containing protein [Bryobacteraceae bacterium]